MQFIKLANGKRVTLGEYCRSIRVAKSQPDATFPYGQCSDGPASGREIVANFGAMVCNLINRHLPMREDRKGTAARLLRHLRRRGRECKWCGSHFTPESLSAKFCDPSCARAYHC